MNWKLTLSYDGSRYNGWQKQGNTENTIQGKLEQVLSRMAGEPIEVQGAGRTDAGVHALGQVASVRLPGNWEPKQLQDALNQYLPEDIAVLEAAPADERFHARLSAKGKTYRYEIRVGTVPDVFRRKYQWQLAEQPDLTKMRAAAAKITGTRDFRSFCGNRQFKKSTVRTLESIDIQQNGADLTITFRGDGFLPYMVRILTGTLVEIGLGKIAPEMIWPILVAKDRAAAGDTAPAKGLTLIEVRY